MAVAYPHPLRLRGPWDFEVEDGSVSRRGKLAVPGDWGGELGADFAGRVLFSRRFGRPATLDSHERLWLVIEGVDPAAEVTVNGEQLGTVAGYAVPADWDITDLVQPRNLLELDVAAGKAVPRPGRQGLAGGLTAEIRLEVRRRASLQQVALAWQQPADSPEQVRLRLRGYVAGRLPGDDPAAGHELHVRVEAPWGTLLAERVEPEAFFQIEQSLPAWAGPLADVPAGWGPLAEVTVQLTAGDEILWQRPMQTFHRPIQWDAEAQTLFAGTQRFRIPDEVTADGPCRVAEQILTAAEYRRLAERGIAVLQTMPGEWAGELCGLLAQHPAIIGWVADESEILRLPGSLRQGTFHGRPWLARALFAG